MKYARSPKSLFFYKIFFCRVDLKFFNFMKCLAY
jgi:hypothetical protein